MGEKKIFLWFIQACTKLLNLLSDTTTVKQAREIVAQWDDKEELNLYVEIAIIPLLTDREREI